MRGGGGGSDHRRMKCSAHLRHLPGAFHIVYSPACGAASKLSICNIVAGDCQKQTSRWSHNGSNFGTASRTSGAGGASDEHTYLAAKTRPSLTRHTPAALRYSSTYFAEALSVASSVCLYNADCSAASPGGRARAAVCRAGSGLRSWARDGLPLILHSRACGHDGRGCRRPANGKLGAIMTAAPGLAEADSAFPKSAIV